jgi:DHA1 family bicyclomycin/chloramphenicol resistance-like MFS transporter
MVSTWATSRTPSLAATTTAQLTAGPVATVVFLTGIAATDMYVTAFLRVAGDLSGAATQVLPTLTTFFVGIALGQLSGWRVSFPAVAALGLR